MSKNIGKKESGQGSRQVGGIRHGWGATAWGAADWRPGRAMGLAVLLLFGLGSLVALAQAPVNDLFADRILISGSSNTVTGSNELGTREVGEPLHAGFTNGASVWWTWMAPDTGVARVGTVGSDFDTVVAVYTGAVVGQLVLVSENDDFMGQSVSQVEFGGVAGTMYQIAVAGYQAVTGNVMLNVLSDVPPTQPVVLRQPTGAVVIAGTVTNVTFETGVSGSMPIYFQWECNGTNLAGAVGRTLTVTNPTPAEAGAYVVVVSNWLGVARSSNAVLSVLTPAPNDAFANAIAIPGATNSILGHNRMATSEADDPAPLDVRGGQTVWWTWTAPGNGLVQVDTIGSTFDTVMGVYTGATMRSLVTLDENDDAEMGVWGASGCDFRAVSGAVYRILVDGYRNTNAAETASGDIVLHLRLLPDNDFFAARLPLDHSDGMARDSNAGATLEPNEPVHGRGGAGHTVWWTWQTATPGSVTLDTVGSAMPVLLAIYTGQEVTNLTLVGRDDSAGVAARVRFPAATGVVYQIVVDGYAGASNSQGIIVLNLSRFETGNDDFANRIPLIGPTNSATGSNAGAGKEQGEPVHAGNAGGRSVWWAWTAPFDGLVSIATTNSTFDTLLGVYTGRSPSSLTLIAENDDVGGSNRQSAVSFDAVGGVEYQIAVDGYNYGGEVYTGVVQLSIAQLRALRPGDNDNLDVAFAMVGQHASVTGSNATASKETDEPSHAGNRGGRSIWWVWTAPSAEPVTIDTIGSTFDTVLGVYEGTNVASLTRVGSDDDSAAEVIGWSRLTFIPRAGETYRIAVDGYNGGSRVASGQVVLNLLQYPPGPQMANDHFSDRTPIPSWISSLRGSNIGATPELNEPSHFGAPASASVWWSWVAPRNGAVTISTAGSEIDTVLAVYVGNAVDSLTLVADSDDIGGGDDSRGIVRFQASAGVQYQIVVEGYGGAIGGLALGLSLAADEPMVPEVTDQPQDQTRYTGGAGGGSNVTFRVAVVGSMPLRYQWRKQGVDVVGATGSVLTIVNAGVADAGAYTVLVSNELGVALSDAAVLRVVQAASNDDFSRRLPIQGTTGTVYGSVLGAGKEPGEPNHGGNEGGRSLWWSWVAPGSGLVTIDTLGSTFDTCLGVYAGTNLQALSLVVENDDAAPGHDRRSFVEFVAQAGIEYVIAVDGYKTNGLQGSVVVNVRQPPAAPLLVADPVRTTVVTGETANLSVSCIGAALRYQWFVNHAPLAGETNGSLSLVGATTGQRGSYSVSISNSYGVVTSQVAEVWVRLREPVRQELRRIERLDNGGVRFDFGDAGGSALPDGSGFAVEWTDALAGERTVWTRSVLSVRVENGRLVFDDTVPAGVWHRLYRVVER